MTERSPMATRLSSSIRDNPTAYHVRGVDALVIASFKGASFVPCALVLGGNASNLGGRPW